MKFGASVIKTHAALEPVSLAEAKVQLRVRHDEDDAYITSLITVARRWAEEFTKRAFISQSWRAEFPSWPCGDDNYFELPRSPLITVDNIKYYDPDNTYVTVASSNYIVDIRSFPGRVTFKSSFTFPSLSCDRLNPVSVCYTAGYGAAAENVPADIRAAVLLMLTHLYVNRSPIITGTITAKLPLSAESLLNYYRRRLV